METTQPTLYQFKGSPDVFDEKGAYVSADVAKANKYDLSKVTQLTTPRPEVKSEADFSSFSGKPVSVDSIINASPKPSIPTPNQMPDYNGIVKAANASVESAQSTYDKNYQDIISLSGSLEGQSADQIQAENEQGVPEKKKTLSDLNASLKELNASAETSRVQSEGRQTTMGQIIGEQGQIEKVRAAKALSISAQIQAAQGNLTLAEDQANRAVDLKYNAIKDKLVTLNTTLKYNYEHLTSTEKKQADAMTLQNNIQLKKLDEKILTEKNNEAIFNQALANGAPLPLVTQARNLAANGNSDAAFASLSPYTGTKSNQVGDGKGGGLSFTSTQINKGVANSGLSVEDFKRLDDISKNYFINNGSKLTSATKLISEAKAGTLKADEAQFNGNPDAIKTYINSQNIPDPVKDYLVKHVDEKFPKSENKGGLWDSIKNLFSKL